MLKKFKTFFKERGAQIGVFVLISFIIVVLGILFFTMSSDSIKLFQDEKSSYKVKEFVESCINVETAKAEREVALHGGWLYSPFGEDSDFLFGDRNTNKYLVKSMRGYRDLGGVKIPYWYYYDDKDEEFKTNIPEYDSNSKYSIKNQIKRYLDENIEKNCIKGFEDFKYIYDIDYDPKSYDFNVEFNREDMYIFLNMPLKINEINSNNSEFIEDFKIKKENKLWGAYNLAVDIIEAETNFSFIEKRILNFISPYQSSQRRDLLPPFYDYQLKYDFKPWKISDSEKLFKQILSSNIGYIQFMNTHYKEFKLLDSLKDSDFARSISNLYTKDYLSENSKALNGKKRDEDLFNKYKDYTVDVNYEPFYPTFFSINPSLGDMILLPRPESVINIIPIFFTEYVAVYEITNPIIFEIRTSNKNDNFLFNLAIESNIDHNTPLAENRVFNFSFEKLNLKSDKTLICDPNQRVSGYIYLNISDPIVNGKRKYIEEGDKIKKYHLNRGTDGIEDAIVTFKCKGLTTCYIGSTRINANNSKGNITQMKFRLPINCDPGTLEISKFGYQKLVFDNLDPKPDEEINLGEYYMSSEKEFDLKVKLLSRTDSKYSLGKALRDHQTGFIIFENKENSDYVQVVEINKENQFNLKIKLIPGNYSVQGFVIYNSSVYIPSKEICYSKGLFSGKECQTIPEINMDSWIMGGLDLENFEITTKQALFNNKIIVPLVNYGIPESYDDLEDLTNTMGDLKNLSVTKQPYFEFK